MAYLQYDDRPGYICTVWWDPTTEPDSNKQKLCLDMHGLQGRWKVQTETFLLVVEYFSYFLGCVGFVWGQFGKMASVPTNA